MKRFLWFLLGAVVGVAGTLAFLYFLGMADDGTKGKDYEMNFFDQPGQVMEARAYRVIQAWPNGTALAGDDSIYGDILLTVLLWNKTHEQYYDQQVVKAAKNQVFRQIGLCRYKTANENLGFKTVPIVELVDK